MNSQVILVVVMSLLTSSAFASAHNASHTVINPTPLYLADDGAERTPASQRIKLADDGSNRTPGSTRIKLADDGSERTPGIERMRLADDGSERTPGSKRS